MGSIDKAAFDPTDSSNTKIHDAGWIGINIDQIYYSQVYTIERTKGINLNTGVFLLQEISNSCRNHEHISKSS